jgi:hypothetical protein
MHRQQPQPEEPLKHLLVLPCLCLQQWQPASSPAQRAQDVSGPPSPEAALPMQPQAPRAEEIKIRIQNTRPPYLHGLQLR